jgi:hypothetical protein
MRCCVVLALERHLSAIRVVPEEDVPATAVPAGARVKVTVTAHGANKWQLRTKGETLWLGRRHGW